MNTIPETPHNTPWRHQRIVSFDAFANRASLRRPGIRWGVLAGWSIALVIVAGLAYTGWNLGVWLARW